jgi:hypothetical protein
MEFFVCGLCCVWSCFSSCSFVSPPEIENIATTTTTNATTADWLLFSCHSVALVLKLIQIKETGINIHERNSTKHSKYKYTHYQNTHTLQNPHIHIPIIPTWIRLLVTTFLTVSLNVFSLQGKDASKLTGNWFHLLMVLFTKEYLPASVLCFLVLIFRLWSSVLSMVLEFYPPSLSKPVSRRMPWKGRIFGLSVFTVPEFLNPTRIICKFSCSCLHLI